MQPTGSAAKSVGMVVVFALVGWSLCGVVMYAAMDLTTTSRALAIHALAAPFIFAVLSFIYFRRPGSWSPLAAAAVFLGIVIAMDLFVVAFLIEKSFNMFGSIRGTWLPFTLIFASTWWTGRAMRRLAGKAAQQQASE